MQDAGRRGRTPWQSRGLTAIHALRLNKDGGIFPCSPHPASCPLSPEATPCP